MTITFTLYSVVVLILVLNSILEHLFSWIFRTIYDGGWGDNKQMAITLTLYAIKWFVVLVVLSKIME